MENIFHHFFMEHFFHQVFKEEVQKEFVPRRGYYGNACKVCFCKRGLKKCLSCKTISYCSKQHQRVDWPFHKKLCKALKVANETIICKSNCTFEEFTEYREKLAAHLKKSLGENNITHFEREIVQFPWVCAVCYSKSDLNVECENCSTVVYCSQGHKRQDEKVHKLNCDALKMAKILDSLFFKYGFHPMEMNFSVQGIPKSIDNFPSDKKSLGQLLQRRISSTHNMHDKINLSFFNSVHSTGATILFSLEKIALIRKRVYLQKPFLPFEERQRRTDRRSHHIVIVPPITVNTIVIHVVASEFHEVTQKWESIVFLLLQWMQNIEFIEIKLIGPSLSKYEQPQLDGKSFSFNFKFCPVPYKNIIDHLSKPDIIILLNYGLTDKAKREFQDLNSKKTLFKYQNVPLIITSTKQNMLTDFVCMSKQLDGVKVKLNVRKNPFAETHASRIWDHKHMSTSYLNQYVTILTRE